MKYLKNTLPLLLALLMVTVTVQAQQIDANRLNRDIKIMENILSEMFRVRPISSGNRVSTEIFAYTSSRSGSNDIRGTYLPDYGVIFQIPKPTNFSVVINNGDSDASGFSFYYGDDDSGENTVTKEGITNRIIEFLRDYGSTMGQLSGDDHVMVIYGSAAARNNVFGVISRSRTNSSENNQLPVISVSATMSDLNASRSGSLSDEQFRNRVSVSESEANSNGNMDLRVMANIIETAFSGGEEDRFRVRGSVDHLKLDNFGALFYFDARYGSGSSYSIRTLTPSTLFFSRSSDSTTSSAETRAVLEETRARLAQVQEENEEKREELARATTAAFETFKQELREYLVDYGRTLGSVNPDQFILLSVTLNSSVDGIPDRLDVQIAKSVLQQLDQGRTSREQALEQVSLREY